MERITYSYISNSPTDSVEKRDYTILIKKDGKFFVGYCIEIPQARGQGYTRDEAILDTKKAIRICRSYLVKKMKSHPSKAVTVSV